MQAAAEAGRASSRPVAVSFLSEICQREAVLAVAELAGDLERAVDLELLELVLRQRLEHGFDALLRAAALRARRMALEDANALLVEQPIEQVVDRQIGIEQFLRRAARQQG